MDSGIVPMFIIGGIFVFLGILGFVWSRIEEGAWYSSISEHFDVREFMDHSPGRFEPHALKIGGEISILVGVVLILIAGAFSIW